jgi:glycosyltransferase involved in cell wall biosynthesis
MKTISILVPCYNEQENVVPMSKALVDIVTNNLPQYDYEIIFIDNHSKDNTRPLLREICARNSKIKAIFNARNFGQFNSPYYGMLQCTGDCVITLCCDFQDPPEMIPPLVKEWEAGYKIVSCIKTTSKENKLLRFLRSCYYKAIKKLSSIEQIEHFTGTGLYDKSFVDILRNLHDPTPFLRGIVAELGFKRKDFPYTQEKRRAGRTHNNFFTLYDAAMLSFTTYTKSVLRFFSLLGFISAAVAFIVGVGAFFTKIFNWWAVSPGIASVTILVAILGGLQLLILGFIGEYIMNMNQRILNRPLVIEEERINF